MNIDEFLPGILKSISFSTILVAIILLGGAFFAASFYSKNKSLREASAESEKKALATVERLEEMRRSRIDAEVSSIQLVLGDSIVNNNPEFIVLLFGPYDCYSCVEEGAVALEEIEMQTEKNGYAIAVSMYDSLLASIRANRSHVFMDTNAILKNELNMIQTPALLYIKDNIVKELYFPSSTVDSGLMKDRLIARMVN
ncbi:MAG: hypothetical protein AAF564_09290 [Bacteroidota bacterium]